MVSDYKELCARLRMACYCGELQGAGTCQPCLSADAIEAQAREIEELRKTVHLAWNERDEVMRENDALRARAEAAEGLLREAFDHSPAYMNGTGWPTRVAAHFDSINSKGDDK